MVLPVVSLHLRAYVHGVIQLQPAQDQGKREAAVALCDQLQRSLRRLPGKQQVREARPVGPEHQFVAPHQLRLGPHRQTIERIDAGRPQFLPLLPGPHAFAAFLLTCRCWDELGLFDANFHPAYCEDLNYCDRLAASPGIDRLDGGFAHAAMTALNSQHSATINSAPSLQRHNRTSYALNRLWYLSERRLRRDPRGSWRRLWLSQWRHDPANDG